MASSSSLTLPTPRFHAPSSSRTRRAAVVAFCKIRASVVDRPLISISESSPAPPVTKLPVRKIPGDCGLPIIGPIKDRQDYFYHQGRDEFFRSRIKKYNSTVFRTNMPPGPSISFSAEPNVVVLLDAKSFPTLFDTSKVEKKDLFTGTFMPSLDHTGGYRMLSYLDPSEPHHAKLKQMMFYLLQSNRGNVIPEFQYSYKELFDSLETDLAAHGKASFPEANDQAAFNFLARALHGSNPADSKLGVDGPKIISKWVLLQLAPVLTLGLPKPVEELLLRTFRLPAFLIKSDYQRLYDFFYESSDDVLDEASRMGISRDEACHNLLFATCFNSFGGMKILFPNLLKWVGRAGGKLHSRLAMEIRSAVRTYGGGKVTMAAMEQMPLMKSVVYESFRIEPPVPSQYGKAKCDFKVESHDAVFEVKEGEMLYGYQPFATRDPKVFERAEEFIPERFMGDGEELLKYVLWSNGRETERASAKNKQCAGKDFVMLVARLLLVEFFMRYDSFEMVAGKSALGCKLNITSLKRATF